MPRRPIGLVIVGRPGNSSKRFLDGCAGRLIPKRSSRPRQQIIINLKGCSSLHMYILSVGSQKLAARVRPALLPNAERCSTLKQLDVGSQLSVTHGVGEALVGGNQPAVLAHGKRNEERVVDGALVCQS